MKRFVRFSCNLCSCRTSLFSKYTLLIILFGTSIVYLGLKVRLSIHYRQAERFYLYQQSHQCQDQSFHRLNRTKLILFWTKIFSDPPNVEVMNRFLWNSCPVRQCEVIKDRRQICRSDAIIFHARGGLNPNDLPKRRSTNQRYVLLNKEPPYKTTAMVGHLDYFFNWTATYRRDSDIQYPYFYWRHSRRLKQISRQEVLQNRRASAAVMISNCNSESNREDYIKRLGKVIPIKSVGFCTYNKCHRNRHTCIDELSNDHPFYLAFENSLCQDYATEKYANVLLNSRMVPIVFSKNTDIYIPNSFIDASSFSTPEDLGNYLKSIVQNRTAYENYFLWKNEYDLIIPNEYDFLCELCQKLNNNEEPTKFYRTMKHWLYEEARCQRWNSKSNKPIDISVDETMDYVE